MTNGDRIRNMSDPELAMWITKLLADHGAGQRIAQRRGTVDDKAAADNLRWLEQEEVQM